MKNETRQLRQEKKNDILFADSATIASENGTTVDCLWTCDSAIAT